MYRFLASPGDKRGKTAPHDCWPAPASNTIWRRLGPVGLLPEAPGAEGPTARSDEIARLEAVLLISQEPLGSRKVAELAGLADGTKARTLVRRLNQLYDQEECAFRVMEVAGGFHLMSRPKFAPWLRRLCDLPVEVRLSAPAMETLAVVAYRQPVLRAAIEAIRGVQCGEILRQLMDRDLVRIAGRSDELGRPFLYGTTRHFLQVFGLRHIDEIPRPRRMQAAEAGLSGDAAGVSGQISVDPGTSNQSTQFSQTEGGPNVKSAADTTVVPEEVSQLHAAAADATAEERSRVSNGDGFDEEYEDDYEDDEYEDEGEDDDYEDDEDDEDDDYEEDEDEEDDYEDDEYEEDDEDLEDPEWEDVDDEDEEDEDEEDEDEEDEDDWDDDDWDDEEEDEEDDWDDEDEDEDEDE